MLANKREKIIAVILIAVVGLLIIYQYVLMPYLDERARVAKALEDALRRENRAQHLLDARASTNQAWHDLQVAGLKTDPAAAETQALRSMHTWAETARVDVQSLKPDRVARSGDFQQIRIQATGNTTTGAFAKLLSQIETATIPMRVNDLRLTSRKEGTDDLSFAMSVSTIVFSPAPPKPAANRPASKGEAR